MRLALLVCVLLVLGQVATAQSIPDKAEKILDRAVKSLIDEAERLAQSGKAKDAEAVAALVKDLEIEILKRKDSPDAVKVRQVLFARRLIGKWKRITFPDSYEFMPDGTITATIPSGQTANRATFQRFVSDNCVEYKWTSGHVWHIHYSGPSVLAITESIADARAGDGIVLERK